MNIYVELTHAFNRSGLRAVLGGGQAVVLHRLAIMSKDGDWILREDAATTDHILSVLGTYGARYRFGAPLDIRWLAGGWSSHLEFQHGGIRVRTDFVTRPARLTPAQLEQMWCAQHGRQTPFAGACELAEMKRTQREKDYAVIGELARIMPTLDDQLLHSRSARDLMQMAAEHPDRLRAMTAHRPLLALTTGNRTDLESALDAERRLFMHADEARLARYTTAAEPWADAWPDVSRGMEGLPLDRAHEIMLARATNVLPCSLPEPAP